MKKSIKWKLAQFLEIRWWQLYQKNKSQTYLQSKKAYWEKIVRAFDPYIQTGNFGTALDAGCGPSGMYMILNGKVDAVDPLLDSYEQQIDFFTKDNYPDVHFHSLPFEIFEPDYLYQQIFCMNALNHFSDLEASIDKLFRLLAPGGYLLVGLDVHNKSWLPRLFRFLSFDMLHPHQFSAKKYIAKFEKAGFRLIQSTCDKKGIIFNYELFLFTKNQ